MIVMATKQREKNLLVNKTTSTQSMKGFFPSFFARLFLLLLSTLVLAPPKATGMGFTAVASTAFRFF